jgi:hypothetical protein
MERMAPANPFDAAPRPSHCPVFANGLNEIIAARRLKTALAAHERAQRPMIDARCPNQQRSRQVPDLSGQLVHERLSSRRLDRSSILV